MEMSLKHHIVDLERCGPVSCYLQGDLEKQREDVVFLTVHDVGCTYLRWYDFVMNEAMDDIRKRAMFIHVALPGQEPGAEDLPDEFQFPKMKHLGLNLVSILDHLRIPRVVGLGDGAGANIITRFGMSHPNRVHGIVTINNSATRLGATRFMERLKMKIQKIKPEDSKSVNKKNVAKFAEAYKKRTEILPDLNKRINFDVLLIAGVKSKYVEDTKIIHKEMAPGLCSMIKVEDVDHPLSETPARVAEAVLLFSQGIGLMPSLVRRCSRQGSTEGHESYSDGRKKSLSSDREKELMDPSLKHHIVNLEKCGPVSVFIQGDLEKQKDGVVFLTVHDVGSSYMSWRDFVMDTSMEDIRKRASFVHVAIPGQEPGASDLQKNFVFPTMKDLGLNLVSILDYLRIPQVVGLGDGAGANIITRFGMCHPARVHGVFTINSTAQHNLGRFMEKLKEKMKATALDGKLFLNEKNVSKFAEAFKKRTEILPELNKKINFDFLLMAGIKSKYVEDTEMIHKEMAPGLCSMIIVEDVSEPLTETPGRVSEAVLLFCQGMGLMPSIPRKFSRQGSLISQDSGYGERI
eukprot:GFUD01013877.1.p1 GENE.GFUD01013877.1~~GFUD01013877.1.p1  ORF type:complete len:575 (-),score=168.18 GFUD01013877.1:461-2185(-)